MQPQTLRVKIETDGEVLLRDLPVRAGDEVVIRLEPAVGEQPAEPQEADPPMHRSYGSMRGSIQGYDDPFGPACPEEDWETPLD